MSENEGGKHTQQLLSSRSRRYRDRSRQPSTSRRLERESKRIVLVFVIRMLHTVNNEIVKEELLYERK